MHAPANPVSSPAPTPEMLQPQQVQAAHLLASGMGFADVCHELSVGRATLYRWRQDPDFAAYLHRLLRQTADHATCRSTRLLELAHDVIEKLLTSPDTPDKLKLQIAFRIASLYSRPGHLKYIQSLIEDPDVIIYNDACRDAKLTSMDPKSLDGSDIDLRRMFDQQRLERAQAFDARYPDPEALLRNTMRQNETSGASASTSKAAASAISAALAGVRLNVASAVQ